MKPQFPAAAVALTAMLLASPACEVRKTVRRAETTEEAPRLASTVRLGDPVMARQLVSGFYDIEARAWRWTAQKFAVNLRPPVHAAQNGAVLEFRFTLPRSSLDKLGSIAMKATVGGAELAPETYAKDGEHVYRRDVPGSALGGDTVRVDFELDKAIAPGDVDRRQLGVVAASVGLVAK